MKFPTIRCAPTATLLLLSLYLLPSLAAKTRLSNLFSDGAVLQRDQNIAIWGWDEPKTEVQVVLSSGEKKSVGKAKADSEGKWLVQLPPLAGGNQSFELLAKGSTEAMAKDVLLGDVYVLFGRSNVGLPIWRMLNAEEEIAKADFPLVHQLSIKGNPSYEPQEDADTSPWVTTSPDKAKRFSAVAHLFASELYKKTGFPVGLIKCNWGGSPGKMWIRRDIYGQVFAKGKEPDLDWLKTFEAESKAYHTQGDGEREYGDGKADNKGPGSLYEPFVRPILGLSVSSIIFYCSGTTTLETEIFCNSTRQAWGKPDMPVLLVQIPASGGPRQVQPQGKGDPDFRAQFCALDRSGRIPNSRMIVTFDTCDQSGERNIHPSNKRPVGERLALAAMDLVYHKGSGIGPILKSTELKGPKAILHFDTASIGLAVGGINNINTSKDLEGFAISADGNNWQWAKAEIQGENVVLSSESESPITQIRYAMGSNPLGNLIRKDGLPASPFATDIQYP